MPQDNMKILYSVQNFTTHMEANFLVISIIYKNNNKLLILNLLRITNFEHIKISEMYFVSTNL